MTRALLLAALSLTLSAETVRIIQTNSAGDDALLIDPATNKVTLHIADLEGAHGVTVSPDGSKGYFTVEADSTVKAYDLKNGKLLGSVKLTGHPNNIAISKDGKRIFAGIAVAPGAVDVIDAATMKRVQSVPIKGAVHNVYVTPDGKYMVAGSVGGSIVQVFDAETLAPSWELKMDHGVRCMAFEKAADGSTSRLFMQLSDVHGVAVIDFKAHKELPRLMLPNEPKNGVAHMNLGIIRLEARDVAGAETELRQALALDPGLASAYTALGVVFMQKNATGDAVEAWKRAVEIGRAYV